MPDRRSRARADFEPGTWLMAMLGWNTSAPELLAAQHDMHTAARRLAAFFEDHDLFLTPTLACPPARIGELAAKPGERRQVVLLRSLPLKRLLRAAFKKLGGARLAYTPNTQLFNQTGQPAMSVPLYWNNAGLPIGVQLAARFGDEATLFRVAAQLEEARPWANRLPPDLED